MFLNGKQQELKQSECDQNRTTWSVIVQMDGFATEALGYSLNKQFVRVLALMAILLYAVLKSMIPAELPSCAKSPCGHGLL